MIAKTQPDKHINHCRWATSKTQQECSGKLARLEATCKGTLLLVVVVVRFGVSEWVFCPEGMLSTSVGDCKSHINLLKTGTPLFGIQGSWATHKVYLREYNKSTAPVIFYILSIVNKSYERKKPTMNRLHKTSIACACKVWWSCAIDLYFYYQKHMIKERVTQCIITMCTVVYSESIPHTLSCCLEYLLMHQTCR